MAEGETRFNHADRFRFRAWDGSTMWDHDQLTNELLRELLCGEREGWVLMQSTGLVGRFGGLVFEGDVVEARSQGDSSVFEVVWRQEGHPCFILYPAWADGSFWHLHGSRLGDADGRWHDPVRVLGNAYEHPHLRPGRPRQKEMSHAG